MCSKVTIKCTLLRANICLFWLIFRTWTNLRSLSGLFSTHEEFINEKNPKMNITEGSREWNSMSQKLKAWWEHKQKYDVEVLVDQMYEFGK